MHDIKKLREVLLDNYGSAMGAGFGMAVMGMVDVETASDKEIVELAIKEGIIKR